MIEDERTQFGVLHTPCWANAQVSIYRLRARAAVFSRFGVSPISLSEPTLSPSTTRTRAPSRWAGALSGTLPTGRFSAAANRS